MENEILPLNTRWNRDCKISSDSGSGYLFQIENQLAYFTWEYQSGEKVNLVCEEGVFLKNFTLKAKADERSPVFEKGKKYLRYPFDIISEK